MCLLELPDPPQLRLLLLLRRVERLDLNAGDWVYKCDGPVNALVDLALGKGSNLSPGRIGAETTATIAAMLSSSAAGGAARDVSSTGDLRAAS